MPQMNDKRAINEYENLVDATTAASVGRALTLSCFSPIVNSRPAICTEVTLEAVQSDAGRDTPTSAAERAKATP